MEREPRDRRAYKRRTPERNALHQLVSNSLAPLRELLSRQSPYHRGLPRYIERELEEYLRCGVLEHGFARVVCGACRAEHLVAFSCKRRGICPSCTGRRMSDTAAHLVERVLPHVPIRQWVVTFSRQARYHLAADGKLATEVCTKVLRAIFAWQRRSARALGERPSRANSCGAITFVQRFNSALELSYHLHILIPDGVFIRDSGDEVPRFVELIAPTTIDVERLLKKIITRTEQHLRKRGRLDDDAVDVERAPELFAIQRVLRPDKIAVEVPPLCARQDGYSLHAATYIRAEDRAGLERLCRYGLRPPLSVGRLTALNDGSYTYRMKRRYSDGRELLRFSGEDLLLRLIGLIPPPRRHLVRYAGIFAPHARGRYALTGRGLHDKPPTEESRVLDLPTLCRVPPPDDAKRPRRLDWATLLRRTFSIDVLTCTRCQGRMRLLSVIESPAVIARILSHLHLTAAPARAGPQFLVDTREAFDGIDAPAYID